MLKSLGFIQIAVLLIVATLFVLTWDFGRRVVENVQLVQAAQAADTELARLEREQALLLQLKRDVVTDAWVERIARTMLHYTREWETLFVPIQRVTPVPTPVPAAPVQPSARPEWQDWLEAVFGKTE